MSYKKHLQLFFATLYVISFFPAHQLLAQPAFKGAEGFGSETTHARGTRVCIVRNLDDVDKKQRSDLMARDSFRYCLARASEFGGAYIVFDVSGTITLKRPALIPSNTYVAGQTSFGGIAIKGQAIVVKDARDVVIRHIRHREAKNEGDAFTITNSRNLVIDHVSISFFKDGAVDFVDGSSDATIQWSHMGDAIDSGSKKERYHGQPNLLRTEVNRISMHHNFYTHGHTRMPLVTHTVAVPGFLMGFSNNIIYNYGKYPSRFAAVQGRANVIGNYYIPGRNSHSDGAADPKGTKGSSALLHKELAPGSKPPIRVENGMQLFLKHNLMEDGFGHDASNYTDKYGKQIEMGVPGPVTSVRKSLALAENRMVASGPGKLVKQALAFKSLANQITDVPAVTIFPTSENLEIVLKSFGALPRDNTDKRLVEELRSRSGRWKYSKPRDNNNYEQKRIVDSDFDGLPDEFEKRAGKDIAPIGNDLNDRLDNIEIYLDQIADTLLD